MNTCSSRQSCWGNKKGESTLKLVSEKVIGQVIKNMTDGENQALTNRNTTVGATEVDVALRDGGHAELVKGPGKECGESAGKHDIAVPHGTTYRHAHL